MAQASQKTDKAMDLSTAALSEIKTLHVGEDALYERVVLLDHSQRQNNLKLRGLPEDVGEGTDLPRNPFSFDWVTTHLAKSLAEIIFLQETHVKDSSKHPAPHRKFPTFFSAPGSSKSRGVAILLAGHLQFQLKEVIRDPRGWYVIVKGLLESRLVTLASLYAPNSGQLEFLESTLEMLDSVKEGLLLVGGDLNSVMDLEWDKSCCPGKGLRSLHSKTKVHDLLTRLHLVDVWWLRNPSQRDYTYYSPRHMVFSRIDYFLTDAPSRASITSCTIGPMLWTDHAWLECTVNIVEKTETHKRWSFDNTILLSEFWREELARELKEYFQINESDQMPLPTLWDAMKAVIRGKAISAASAMKRKRRDQRQSIIDNITNLEQLHKRRGGEEVVCEASGGTTSIGTDGH